MSREVRPSLAMWKHYRGDITPALVAAALADRIAGFYMSNSASNLLLDLELLTKTGKVNKKGRVVLGCQIHEQYHRKEDGIRILEPSKR